MNKKSIIKKSSLLVLIGLVVSMILYPSLHELGHVIATILVGGHVKQVTLFPLPSVLCELTETSPYERVIIGLSGGILPVLVSLIYTPKSFSLWYANLLLRFINIYNLCLDYVYAILFFIGSPVGNNDITEILSIDRNNIIISAVLNTSILVLLCVSIRKATPISTTLNYFSNDL